jgi:hypothetical protein
LRRVESRASIGQGCAGAGLESRRKKVEGKPYEGELHVRFEAAGDGDQDRKRLVRHSHITETESKRIGLL